MKRHFKKVISVLLAFVIALGCASFAFAEDNCPSAKFVDVPGEGHWAHNGIDYVVSEGLFAGTSDTTFSPNDNMTRAMIVTVLFRFCGGMLYKEINPFTDVPEGAWYTNGVIWAYNEGIASGTAADKFSPNAPVTREQVCCFLYNCAMYCMYEDVSAEGDLSAFIDADEVSNWAKDAVIWCTKNGFMSGKATKDGAMIAPKENATRAEIATLIAAFASEVTPHCPYHIKRTVACDFTIRDFESLANPDVAEPLHFDGMNSYTDIYGNIVYFFDPYGICDPDFAITIDENKEVTYGRLFESLDSTVQNAIHKAIEYGYPNTHSKYLNSVATATEQYIATQALIWEFVTGVRMPAPPYKFASKAGSYVIDGFAEDSGVVEAYNFIFNAIPKAKPPKA